MPIQKKVLLGALFCDVFVTDWLAEGFNRISYNLLRNRDEARDCMQDVYAELWNKRDTIEPDKPPHPFVLTMVRNNCLDRW